MGNADEKYCFRSSPGRGCHSCVSLSVLVSGAISRSTRLEIAALG